MSCGVSVFLWALSQHETGQAQALGLANSVESLAGEHFFHSYKSWYALPPGVSKTALVSSRWSEKLSNVVCRYPSCGTDLRKLFSVLPVLVAVRGRVGSTSPKRCELGDKDAVVHEVGNAQRASCRYLATSYLHA